MIPPCRNSRITGSSDERVPLNFIVNITMKCTSARHLHYGFHNLRHNCAAVHFYFLDTRMAVPTRGPNIQN